MEKGTLLSVTIFSILESNPFNYFVIVVSFSNSQLFYQQKQVYSGIARGIAIFRL